MTILFGTGFEDGGLRGTTGSGAAVNGSAAHTGSYGLSVANNVATRYPLPSITNGTEGYLSVWMKCYAGNGSRLALDDGTNGWGVDFRFNPSTQIGYLYTNNTLRDTGGTMDFTAWHLYEFYFKAHDTTGFCTIKVDGTEYVSATGVDTIHLGTDNHGLYLFNGALGGAYQYVDDVTWGTGGYFGDVRYDILMPNADTADEDWTPSTGADSYALVDEKPASDSDYLSSYTAADRTILGFADGSWTDKTIVVAIPSVRIWKEAGTSQTCKLITKSGATTDVESTGQALGTTAGYIFRVDEVDPNTSSAWTTTNLDAAQFGFETA
jgi:hypothetical protein